MYIHVYYIYIYLYISYIYILYLFVFTRTCRSSLCALLLHHFSQSRITWKRWEKDFFFLIINCYMSTLYDTTAVTRLHLSVCLYSSSLLKWIFDVFKRSSLLLPHTLTTIPSVSILHSAISRTTLYAQQNAFQPIFSHDCTAHDPNTTADAFL